MSGDNGDTRLGLYFVDRRIHSHTERLRVEGVVFRLIPPDPELEFL